MESLPEELRLCIFGLATNPNLLRVCKEFLRLDTTALALQSLQPCSRFYDIAKDTEQDLVLVPSAHWHLCLKPKVEKLLSKKVAHSRHVEFDDTSVVVSLNDRSQRDLTKRFDNMDVDWSIIERQLI
jgi:hypothetical protein